MKKLIFLVSVAAWITLVGCTDFYKTSLKPENVQKDLKDNPNGGFLYGTYDYAKNLTYPTGLVAFHITGEAQSTGVTVMLDKDKGDFLIYLAPGKYRISQLNFMPDINYPIYDSQPVDYGITINPGQVVYLGNLTPTLYSDVNYIHWGFVSISNRSTEDQASLQTDYPDLAKWQVSGEVPVSLGILKRLKYEPSGDNEKKM